MKRECFFLIIFQKEQSKEQEVFNFDVFERKVLINDGPEKVIQISNHVVRLAVMAVLKDKMFMITDNFR